MKTAWITASIILCSTCALAEPAVSTYPLVGTQQDRCFDNTGPIECPPAGAPFYGQDAQRPGAKAAYKDNQDGTILDTITGLIWTKDIGGKVTWEEARAHAAGLHIGGFDDWRLPTINELYSLMNFHETPAYIDTRYFEHGDTQQWSSTPYAGSSVFSIDFTKGSISAYPLVKKLYVRYVRGPAYGVNTFEQGVGGVVLDKATHLVWQRADDGKARTWQEALAYCEGLYLSGRADWHLPNAKELQSIVDYDRAAIPAIHPFFTVMAPKGYYWTSTTHPGSFAAFIAFGPDELGPQGDDAHTKHYVRCVTKM